MKNKRGLEGAVLCFGATASTTPTRPRGRPSGAATAGDFGAATSRGSVTVGENGCGLVRGTVGKIKIRGGVGAILVICAESKNSYDIVGWKAAVVDGDTIKSDTWYMLKDGEFVEATDDED